MAIERIGVVGAGVMGSEIAFAAAAAGIDVALRDIERALIDKGIAHIRAIAERRAASGRMTEEDAAALMARVSAAEAEEDLASCGLVIEAVTERMDVKWSVFAALDAGTPAETILTSNTSGLSISELASVTSRPERVLGLHFFNPASTMRLVEVIRGEGTSEATAEAGAELVRRLGKTPVAVAGVPGVPGQPDPRARALRGVPPRRRGRRRPGRGRRGRGGLRTRPDGAVRARRPDRPRHPRARPERPRRGLRGALRRRRRDGGPRRRRTAGREVRRGLLRRSGPRGRAGRARPRRRRALLPGGPRRGPPLPGGGGRIRPRPRARAAARGGLVGGAAGVGHRRGRGRGPGPDGRAVAVGGALPPDSVGRPSDQSPRRRSGRGPLLSERSLATFG